MLKRIALAFICITLASCNMKEEPLVIGHRGAMGHETENTLPSIQKAMDLGVDMIEIDVFKIKSGEIVVFHDETLDRLTNAPGNIEDYYIFDLHKVIVNGGHKIPMLQDVLKLIDNKVALNIELKGAGTADRVNHIMNSYIEKRNWSPENFIISSFNWDELKEMREHNPNVAIAVLTEENPLDAIPVAKELNAVAINPYFKNLDLENANEIRDAGFKIYTWTVNEPADIEAMKRIAVDGIITNFPERIK
ncbi:glycerophosphodiester phosphodiesterase family protein [Maribacter sp. 1_MG-2023]|uniref:glycerophosphodiester phosphodiesterase n=1 Tax=Maribacter sp. 1_MG-2023 TaxID=3062677 RepID=UPI0026E482A0|nr:glycerophosphodiester phosphodiesterase family protein [Maribacter sp. 1_MG-2023]MDO6471045.1 glycerophosphodiester phosphodiesterase family protein [Maribacter sp. 1_MG-2023]